MILDDGGDATNFCQAKYPNIFKNLIGRHIICIIHNYNSLYFINIYFT